MRLAALVLRSFTRKLPPICRRERPARAGFDGTVTDHLGADALVRECWTGYAL